MHDVPRVRDEIDAEPGRSGKSELKRIVSMLTRLVQRTAELSGDRIEYEDEYRDAEYEGSQTEEGWRGRPDRSQMRQVSRKGAKESQDTVRLAGSPRTAANTAGNMTIG